MFVLLTSEASLPMDVVGWVVLGLGLLFAAAWIAGVYR